MDNVTDYAKHVVRHADAVQKNFEMGSVEYAYLNGRRDCARMFWVLADIGMPLDKFADLLRDTAWGTYDPDAPELTNEQMIAELRGIIG